MLSTGFYGICGTWGCVRVSVGRGGGRALPSNALGAGLAHICCHVIKGVCE